MTPLMPDITVNGVTIPSAVIGAEAQNHPAPRGKPGLAWRAAARALATREILLQEARARGLQASPAELAPGQIETEDEALIRQLLELAVEPEPVSDAALRACYDAAPGRFRSPPLWEASHILFPAAPEDGEARAAARRAAEATLAELQAAPLRFEDLARERSACSSRSSGGHIGQVGPGDTVAEFEAAMALLSPGEIAPEPVETRFGFHVLRLDASAEGAVLPYASVEPRLREAAEKAAWMRASRAFLDRLIAGASVEGITLSPSEAAA